MLNTGLQARDGQSTAVRVCHVALYAPEITTKRSLRKAIYQLSEESLSSDRQFDVAVCRLCKAQGYVRSIVADFDLGDPCQQAAIKLCANLEKLAQSRTPCPSGEEVLCGLRRTRKQKGAQTRYAKKS